MYQLFTLFVLSLMASGYVIGYRFFSEKLHIGGPFDEDALSAPRFSLILAITVLLLSVLRLIFSSDVTFFGDLLPALAGLLSGLILLTRWVYDRTEEPATFFSTIHGIFEARKDLVGVLIAVIALVHFIFPTVVVL